MRNLFNEMNITEALWQRGVTTIEDFIWADHELRKQRGHKHDLCYSVYSLDYALEDDVPVDMIWDSDLDRCAKDELHHAPFTKLLREVSRGTRSGVSYCWLAFSEAQDEEKRRQT